EFMMKDAYSFHLNQESLSETYEVMYQTCSRIFPRLGLQFRAVIPDTGSIARSASHELHLLPSPGEDAIAFRPESDYAANVEMAEGVAPAGQRPAPSQAMVTVDTPNVRSIAEVCAFLQVEPTQTVKTLLVLGRGEDGGVDEKKVVALV